MSSCSLKKRQKNVKMTWSRRDNERTVLETPLLGVDRRESPREYFTIAIYISPGERSDNYGVAKITMRELASDSAGAKKVLYFLFKSQYTGRDSRGSRNFMPRSPTKVQRIANRSCEHKSRRGRGSKETWLGVSGTIATIPSTMKIYSRVWGFPAAAGDKPFSCNDRSN